MIYRILCFVFILSASYVAHAFENISPKGAERLDQIIGAIKRNHIKKISEEELIEAAANGILTSLDPYSYFYNAKNFEEMNLYSSGEFCGIGVEIKVNKGTAVVMEALDKGPASRAGIVSGDRIISIDNIVIDGMSEHEIMKALLGPPNTKLVLRVSRDGSKINPIKFSVMREKVRLPSVESRFFPDGVFYLKIGAFYENTFMSMGKSLGELKSLQEANKLRGVIIDLRNNTGGLLDQAVDVASVFVKEGNLVSVISPRTNQNIQYQSAKDVFKLNENIPIIVLINKWTASAAEILAGALRDHKRAIIMGEKSFGKGAVQTFLPLKNGEVMSLTTALYTTPSGRVIEDVGITPDIKISSSGIVNKKIKDDFSKREDIINKAVMIIINKRK
jgi:carboxyl-terminal processing protease